MDLPTAVASPTPLASAPPTDFNSAPAWKLPEWGEPVIVAGILFGACFYTRRKYIKIFSKEADYTKLLDEEPDLDDERSSSLFEDDEPVIAVENTKYPSKKRPFFGSIIVTPNSSRFAKHWHSKILQKFPFLMEMFYWVLTYAVYRITHVLSQSIFSDDVWDVAQENGLRILAFEQFSIFRFLFPIQEIQVQRWFMDGHEGLLTVLNRTYALIHIPGSVFFVAWYYYAAPKHSVFAVVRRTVSLANMIAFCVFMSYPCMPPRLLPKEYGFVDTVRRDDAESVWMAGKFVNHLAAMPSMHFGYAFMIGVTLWFHAGAFRWAGYGYENRSSKWWKLWLYVLGFAYPATILVTIVATANHYYLDAIAAVLVAAVALLCNRIFMIFVPLEDLLLWVLQIEKPKPNCGYARR